jgi:hypothetical protein
MSPKKKLAQHIDKKILMRFRIFALISLVFFGILGWDLYRGTITLPLLVVAFAVGIGIGIIASRMNHLSWDHDGKKVVGRIDRIGAGVLVLYIIFAFFRTKIVGVFIHGPMLGTVTVAVMGGLFIGQIIGARNGVRGILKDEGIIK